jgi:hypothetical protein
LFDNYNIFTMLQQNFFSQNASNSILTIISPINREHHITITEQVKMFIDYEKGLIKRFFSSKKNIFELVPLYRQTADNSIDGQIYNKINKQTALTKKMNKIFITKYVNYQVQKTINQTKISLFELELDKSSYIYKLPSVIICEIALYL